MKKLPSRRTSIQDTATHILANGEDVKLILTAGVLEDNKIWEVFTANLMKGSDMEAILTDSCILVSLLLQMGLTLEAIGERLGENRPERGTPGPSASILGTIVKTLIRMQKELENE